MHKKTASRDEVIAAIRTAAERAGTKPVGMRAFFAKSGLRRCDVYKHFASWKEALGAAGFEPDRRGEFIETEDLLADWGAVARKMKGAPTYIYYRMHGKFGPGTLQSRFGSWNNARRAFRGFAEGKKEWADVVKYCGEPQRRGAERGELLRRFTRRAPARPRTDRPVYGEPMDVPGLRNAPMNENGVIFVFGMVAAQLGFHVQGVRTAFPDCDALRWVGAGGWQTMTIEFEFESRNFVNHGHPPDGCDVIVCWVHNWKECPANIEVIALSEKLDLLRGDGAMREMTNVGGAGSMGPVGGNP